MIELTADNLMIDGLTCKKDQYVKIRNILGSTRVNLRFHKGLLVTDLGDEGTAGGDPDAVEVGDDLIVKGHISAFKPDQTSGTPVALGKLAFVDDVSKKFDVTATATISVYEKTGSKRYISSATLGSRGSGENVTYYVDKEYDYYDTYSLVTKTVTITSTGNAVTLGPNEGATVESIDLKVSGSASLK